MNLEERIDREVEETLLCFGRDAAPPARPDFDARLRSRIREAGADQPRVFAAFFRRAVLVPAVLTLLIALNILTAVVARRPTASSVATGRTQAIAALAEELSLQAGGLSSYWK